MSNKQNAEPKTTEVTTKEAASTDNLICEEVDNSVKVEELLAKQKEELLAQQNAIVEQMAAKVDALAEQNLKLTEELTNLKTNTEEENRLLGQKIANIKPEEKDNDYNPYSKKLHYEVYNEEAKATTICTGDEVECIVGMQEHITVKLKKGAKSFDKYPYKVKLIG